MIIINSVGGSITGPNSSTDNALVRWDGTAGTVIQNSGVTIDDNAILNFPTTAASAVTAANYQIGRVFGGSLPEVFTIHAPTGSAVIIGLNGVDEISVDESAVSILSNSLTMNNSINFNAGVVVTAANYQITRDTDVTEQLHFNVPTGASFEFSINDVAEIVLNATNLQPGTNDGLALGASGTAFADLFLASGAVINFNAGDVTVTHSADTLTLAGLTLLDIGAGTLELNNQIRFDTGVAATAGNYQIIRNTDATNSQQYNVPTSAVHIFSINGANRLQIGNDNIIHNAASQCNDNILFSCGSSATSDGGFWYNTLQTPDTLMFLVGGDNNACTFCQMGDRNFDFAHALQTNPTLFIHSATQSTTQWLSLTHDQTDGVINTGAGTLKFAAAAMWTANGTATVTISNVAPAGVGTATISKWFTVVGDDGVTYYIPVWT